MSQIYKKNKNVHRKQVLIALIFTSFPVKALNMLLYNQLLSECLLNVVYLCVIKVLHDLKASSLVFVRFHSLLGGGGGQYCDDKRVIKTRQGRLVHVANFLRKRKCL